MQRGHRIAQRLDSGVVWVNTWLLRDLHTPFGGIVRVPAHAPNPVTRRDRGAKPPGCSTRRVPWEMARAAADQPTLGERNLLVRVVHDMDEPATEPLAFAKDEDLRVLFVFAEAPGSRPLAARLERRLLRKLFDTEIYPQRRIVAHFLTHGVTRERLQAQIQENGGYHIVHWSGHRHLNLLELAKPGGAKDHLSGEALLDLFTRAGGFIPRFFFLSACHSGDILRVKGLERFSRRGPGQGVGHEGHACLGNQGHRAGCGARLHRHRPQLRPLRPSAITPRPCSTARSSPA